MLRLSDTIAKNAAGNHKLYLFVGEILTKYCRYSLNGGSCNSHSTFQGSSSTAVCINGVCDILLLEQQGGPV